MGDFKLQGNCKCIRLEDFEYTRSIALFVRLIFFIEANQYSGQGT